MNTLLLKGVDCRNTMVKGIGCGKQINGIIDNLHKKEYKTVSEY